LFLCEGEDAKPSYSNYRSSGNGYEYINFISATDAEDILNKLGAGFVYTKGAIGLFIHAQDNNSIHVSNMSGLWFCGIDLGLSYDGEQFVIASINVMPFCSNIINQDWISIYQAPSL